MPDEEPKKEKTIEQVTLDDYRRALGAKVEERIHDPPVIVLIIPKPTIR